MENFELLVNNLRKYDTEASWFEFKSSNYTPDMIGQDISALANAAAFYEKSRAYMVWGINDKTHEIVGTEYDQYSLKVGSEEIESWLRKLLSKNAEFEFQSFIMKDDQQIDRKITLLVTVPFSGTYPDTTRIRRKRRATCVTVTATAGCFGNKRYWIT